MNEKGTIVEIRDNIAVVKVEKKDNRRSCNSCTLCKKGQDGSLLLEISNDKGAKQGDTVNIEIDETAILRGIFFIYGVPLIGFILALVFAYLISSLYLKIIVFLTICVLSWSYGLFKGNAEGRKSKVRIVNRNL